MPAGAAFTNRQNDHNLQVIGTLVLYCKHIDTGSYMLHHACTTGDCEQASKRFASLFISSWFVLLPGSL